MAGDADQLFDCLSSLTAATPGQRYQAADCFALRSCAATCFAHSCKELKETVFVFIDGNIEGTATGFHLIGRTTQGTRAIPLTQGFAVFQRQIGILLWLLLLL